MIPHCQPEFGHYIKQQRETWSLTQEQFAHALGVSFCTVNRWENGKTQPSGRALLRLEKWERQVLTQPYKYLPINDKLPLTLI